MKTSTTTFDRLLKAPEVCDRLGVSARTLWNLVRSSQIPFVKIGHATRFRESDVQRFISEPVHSTQIDEPAAKRGRQTTSRKEKRASRPS